MCLEPHQRTFTPFDAPPPHASSPHHSAKLCTVQNHGGSECWALSTKADRRLARTTRPRRSERRQEARQGRSSLFQPGELSSAVNVKTRAHRITTFFGGGGCFVCVCVCCCFQRKTVLFFMPVNNRLCIRLGRHALSSPAVVDRRPRCVLSASLSKCARVLWGVLGDAAVYVHLGRSCCRNPFEDPPPHSSSD